MTTLRLEIDPLRLDDELIGQPKQRQQFGELLADAQLELDTAKSSLAVVQAETDREIREDPEAFGLAKVTEGSVSTAITVHPAVKIAVKKLNEARHKVNVLQAAVDGLEHRRAALKGMVELFGQQYFAGPTTSMPAGIKAENRRRREDESSDDDD